MAKRTAAGTLALAVCLGGGALALAGAANADSTVKFTTVAGHNRAGTAAAAAAQEFSKGADTVILVNEAQNHLVDGLTASYISGQKQAPILYTDISTVPAETQAALKSLGAKNIILMGDNTSISDSLASSLGQNYNVSREGGSNRYATAQKVAADFGGKASTAFVANGDATKLADALAVGPAAYKAHFPILLTQGGDTPAAGVQDTLKALGATPVVVGASISSKQASTLGATAANTLNTGLNRADTAATVASWSTANAGVNTSTVSLVSGNKDNSHLADALVAGPGGSPILFSGAVETTAYLQHHASTLTGTSWVFGDTNAVSQADIDAATAAAQSAVASTAYTVTLLPTGSSSTFGYADPVAKKQIKATPLSTDKFFVGGAAATQGAFVNSLTVGSTVAITAPSTNGGPTTYSLTAAPAAGYWSGLVGAYTPSSGTGVNLGTTTLSASNLAIVEPVTGVSLNTFNYAVNSGNYTLYTVDGANVSKTIFESSLSVGDSVAVTGTGADASHIRTVALTTGSLTGTVASTTGASTTLSALTVQTSAGAILNVPVAASGDTVSIDGTASDYNGFDGTGSGSPVSVGDQVTYSRSGGVGKFALVNAAPSSVSGVIAASAGGQATNGTQVAYYSPAGTATSTTYPASARYVVNGTVASKSDFIAAAAPGSWITYQAPDATTSTSASFTVVSKPLTGAVQLDFTASGTSTAGAGAHTLAIADGDGDLLTSTSGLAYNNATSVYSTGTSLAYTLDGNTATLAQFDSAVDRVAAGARSATVQASVNNGVVTWALSTTAFSAAPSITKVTSAPVSSSTAPSVVVTFNKPVTGASAAAGDWSVGINGSANAATALSWNTAKTVLTITGTSGTATTTGQPLTVAPASATTAAKYSDALGTTVGTGSVSGVIG